MVEQATAASASLEEQASALTRAVGSFKLAETGQAPARPAPAAPQAVPARERGAALSTLPRGPRPPVAELPRNKAQAQVRGKARNENWEEF